MASACSRGPQSFARQSPARRTSRPSTHQYDQHQGQVSSNSGSKTRDSSSNSINNAMVTHLLLLLSASAVLLSPTSAALPRFIGIESGESASNHFAAAELKAELELLCPGQTFLVSSPKKLQKQFLVGPKAALKYGVKPVELAGLGNESFVYRNLAGGNSIFLTGGPGGARGTIYAVYHLLDRLGVKYLAHDETVHSLACPAAAPTGSYSDAPSYEYRDNNQEQVSTNGGCARVPAGDGPACRALAAHVRPWDARVCYNGPSAQLEPAKGNYIKVSTNGGSVHSGRGNLPHPWDVKVGYNGPSAGLEPTRGNYIKYASPPGFVHTSYKLLGIDRVANKKNGVPKAIFEAHKDWFWPQGNPDGSPNITLVEDTYGQLCWSSKTLIAHLILEVKTFLRAQPDANIISVSQNDNGNRCNSTDEQRINNAEGSPMGALLRAVNAIAAAVGPEFPHVAVDTLAYQWSRPATKITKPLPNVIIRLCSIECDFAHPLTHPNNAPFQKDMNNWSRMSNRTYIWDYITNFQNYFVPFPNWYVLGPNIQYFHEHGVKGIFEEGTYGTKGGDLTELKDYIIARSLWNISTDTDDHIKDFVAGYYGPKAGPFVQLYMDVMHGAIAETNYYMRESFDWHAAFLTKMTMLECGKAFKNAQAVATGRYVKRVENAMMPSMFVTLLRWTEFENFAKNESLPWPWKPTKQAQFDYFSELYGAAGVTKLSEGGRDITWLHSELFPTPKPPGPKPPPPPPPPPCPKANRCPGCERPQCPVAHCCPKGERCTNHGMTCEK